MWLCVAYLTVLSVCATRLKLKSRAEENKKKINSLALSSRNALKLCSTVLSQIPTRSGVHSAVWKDRHTVFNTSISIVNKRTGESHSLAVCGQQRSSPGTRPLCHFLGHSPHPHICPPHQAGLKWRSDLLWSRACSCSLWPLHRRASPPHRKHSGLAACHLGWRASAEWWIYIWRSTSCH